MKRIDDLKQYSAILPYASEIFGVYQPLLGWKSKRMVERATRGFEEDKKQLVKRMIARYSGKYSLAVSTDPQEPGFSQVQMADSILDSNALSGSIVNHIQAMLPEGEPLEEIQWAEFINEDVINEALNSVVIADLSAEAGKGTESVKNRADRESVMSRVLLDLTKDGQTDVLNSIFNRKKDSIAEQLAMSKFKDPFDFIDPKNDLDRVGLSPLGIVHLYRQYFFELDTFLGTPVGHVWLSPGAQVELHEVSTRRSLRETSSEFSTASTVRNERESTVEDEISEAVKRDNKNDLKFAANVNAQQNWVWGSANQSASFDLYNSQQVAREHSHRHMRRQTNKLSTEIRKNYKSTFKTVTEYTDTSSKSYVITNSGPDLLNYELRRKMRQVGVQVQDIGTYLCWQSYVDEPGRELGLSNLVHLAKSPDLNSLPHPEQIVAPKPKVERVRIQVPFVGKNSDDKNISYTNGEETHVFPIFDFKETIEHRFRQKVVYKEPNYYLDNVVLNVHGAEAKVSVQDFTVDKTSNEGNFTISLDYVHFHGQNSIMVEATLYWKPDQDEAAIAAENKKRLAEHTAKQAAKYEKAYAEAVRDRINQASNIEERRYEDLREEERIVVYRKLIQELLAPKSKIPQTDPRTRHVVAELINSIFDVDKMLYFVAPEWWKPREYIKQSFGVVKSDGKSVELTNKITSENVVNWGGAEEHRPDNYYITNESEPAKLGSSLGWLMQLDGDNLRNAFLNAPWVKAVIPVRPGKEKAALNWLQQIEGTNGITANDMYTGQEPDLKGKSMLEALEILSDKVRQKHADAIKTSEIPDPANPTDTDSKVTATPVDKVYEHGFYPLKGGFKANVNEDFEVFDQWTEVLPTDQVVAVEVQYDPKTGRQL